MDKSKNAVKINEIQTNLESVIKKQVIEAIGKIERMTKIRAKNVFDSNWRVDIWCELDDSKEEYLIPRLKIKYSYFVVVDAEGNIINSDPELGTECK